MRQIFCKDITFFESNIILNSKKNLNNWNSGRYFLFMFSVEKWRREDV